MLSDTESYGGRVRLGIAILLAVVITSSSLLAYEYLMTSSLQDQNRSLSSEVSTQSAEYSKLESSYLEEFNTSPAVESFQSYTTDIDERNVSAITTEYTPNATMEWKGETWGFGGVYAGSGNIESIWQSFLGYYTKNITATIRSVNATALPNGTVSLDAELLFRGYSPSVGSFNITTLGTYSYVFQSGDWRIGHEITDWLQATAQRSCGAGGPCAP